MTVSQWRRNLAPAQRQADAVVLGAGIAGVSAALALERRGLKVAVLDRDHLAGGASGRNAGFLMRGCAENYAAACRRYGRPRARELWKLTEDNLADLRAEGIDALPSVQRIPSCLLALEDLERAELMESLALLKEDGFRAEWLNPGDVDDALLKPARDARRHALGGLLNPDDGACNPLDVINHLARKLKSPVLERREVIAVEDSAGSDHILVLTAEETWRAPRVLCCLNAYAGLLFPTLATLVQPTRGQMLSIRFHDHPRRRLANSYYANHGYEYFRQTVDGTVVVGGNRKAHARLEVGYEDRTTEPVQQGLEHLAHELFAERFDIVARWSGVMGFTHDGLPLVGPIPGFPSGRVWFCGGFTGHGMSMGFRTATHAVNAMLDPAAPNPFPLDRLDRPGEVGRTAH